MATLSSAAFKIVGHPMAGCQQAWTPIIRGFLRTLHVRIESEDKVIVAITMRETSPSGDRSGEFEDTWFVVLTKPRMEAVAQLNLERQGYRCYAPRILQERVVRKQLVRREVPLFPRYLFIQPGEALSLYSVRSTLGVAQLVSFGPQKIPGRIPAITIEALKREEALRCQKAPLEAFKAGEKVLILEGPFQGLVGVFDLVNADDRVTVLVDFLGKVTRLPLSPALIEKCAD